MNLEEVLNEIKSRPRNEYEIKNGITTGKVEIADQGVDWAILYVAKSDRTTTLFFTIRHKNNIDWLLAFCPSESHLKFFSKKLQEHYAIIQGRNKSKRYYARFREEDIDDR